MDKEELINGYFEGSLSQDQLREFNHLLETDTEFITEFEFQKALQVSLKKNERKDLRAMFDAINIPSKKSDSKVFQIRPWLLAASISLLIGLGSWFFFFNSTEPNTEKLYAANFTPYDNVVSPIERGNEIVNLQQQAFLAYEEGEYQKAHQLFTTLGEQLKEPYVAFYQANILMKLEQHRQAIPLLENYIENDGVLFDRAIWYVSLCHLKLGDIESCKTQLKRLIKLGTFKSNAAQELLAELD